MEITGETLDVIFDALAEQLQALGSKLEIVVIGGSALTALGLVRRATRDVDLLAIAENGELRPAKPLPEALLRARDLVARDFELDENWLNAGPTDLLEWGLPAGFMTRIVTRRYGRGLTVHFAGRVDQIHFKLFAMVDQAGGRHESDLRALNPTPEELLVAARWSVTQDPSPGYRMVLMEALSALGLKDVDL
jgi:Nucleotidyltransferase of unknown function (DUF6036)